MCATCLVASASNGQPPHTSALRNRSACRTRAPTVSSSFSARRSLRASMRLMSTTTAGLRMRRLSMGTRLASTVNPIPRRQEGDATVERIAAHSALSHLWECYYVSDLRITPHSSEVDARRCRILDRPLSPPLGATEVGLIRLRLRRVGVRGEPDRYWCLPLTPLRSPLRTGRGSRPSSPPALIPPDRNIPSSCQTLPARIRA